MSWRNSQLTQSGYDYEISRIADRRAGSSSRSTTALPPSRKLAHDSPADLYSPSLPWDALNSSEPPLTYKTGQFQTSAPSRPPPTRRLVATEFAPEAYAPQSLDRSEEVEDTYLPGVSGALIGQSYSPVEYSREPEEEFEETYVEDRYDAGASQAEVGQDYSQVEYAPLPEDDGFEEDYAEYSQAPAAAQYDEFREPYSEDSYAPEAAQYDEFAESNTNTAGPPGPTVEDYDGDSDGDSEEQYLETKFPEAQSEEPSYRKAAYAEADNGEGDFSGISGEDDYPAASRNVARKGVRFSTDPVSDEREYEELPSDPVDELENLSLKDRLITEITKARGSWKGLLFHGMPLILFSFFSSIILSYCTFIFFARSSPSFWYTLPPSKPVQLNFADSMDVLWSQYARMVTDIEYETWFQDTREADDILTAMYNTMPPVPPGDPTAAAQRLKLKNAVDYRAGLRKRAAVSFENFLRARLVVADQLLALDRDFAAYVADITLSEEEKKNRTALGTIPVYNITIFQPDPTAYARISYTPRNHTAHLLNHAALGYLNHAIALHRVLYISRDAPAVLKDFNATLPPPLPNNRKKHSPTFLAPDLDAGRYPFALTDINTTQYLEAKAIHPLRSQSYQRRLWTKTQAKSLSKLRANLEELRTTLIAGEWVLTQQRDRFAAEIAREYDRSTSQIPEDSKDLLVWTQTPADMLRNLRNARRKLEEAENWARLRLNNLEGEQKTIDWATDLAKWRGENCGAVSTCYRDADAEPGDGPGPWAFLRVLGAGKKEAEKPFARRPRRSRPKVEYEVACCGEAGYNPWSDYFKFGPAEWVYLNPYVANRGPLWDAGSIGYVHVWDPINVQAQMHVGDTTFDIPIEVQGQMHVGDRAINL